MHRSHFVCTLLQVHLQVHLPTLCYWQAGVSAHLQAIHISNLPALACAAAAVALVQVRPVLQEWILVRQSSNQTAGGSALAPYRLSCHACCKQTPRSPFKHSLCNYGFTNTHLSDSSTSLSSRGLALAATKSARPLPVLFACGCSLGGWLPSPATLYSTSSRLTLCSGVSSGARCARKDV